MSAEEAVITFPISFASETESADSVAGKTPAENEALTKLEEFMSDVDDKGLKTLTSFFRVMIL